MAAGARSRSQQRLVVRAAVSSDQAPRRVVVTGLGVVSSLGHEPDEFYNNLLAGTSGISLIEGFDASKLQPCTLFFNCIGWHAPCNSR